MTAVLDDFPLLAAWWATQAAEDELSFLYKFFRIADTEQDQLVPEGVDNPYWELIRHMPFTQDRWDGITPFHYVPGTGIGRHALVKRYAWSIPTPGDIAWIRQVLEGQCVVEVGAGSGYWAWQLAQADVDVIAYDPHKPATNGYTSVAEPYHPLLAGDASAAGEHPDRALFMCWPSYSDPWASQALAAYEGDTLIFAGELGGGCCADDAFFEQLNADWSEVDQSPYHITWWGIHDRLIVYRRSNRGDR